MKISTLKDWIDNDFPELPFGTILPSELNKNANIFKVISSNPPIIIQISGVFGNKKEEQPFKFKYKKFSKTWDDAWEPVYEDIL